MNLDETLVAIGERRAAFERPGWPGQKANQANIAAAAACVAGLRPEVYVGYIQ